MIKPRIFSAAIFAVLLLVVVACTSAPETQVYIVLTPTHQPPTLTALAAGGNAGAVVETEPPPVLTPVAGDSGMGPIEGPTAQALPTPLVVQIQVAEQHFENGRMFWLMPNSAIWVMVNDEVVVETDEDSGEETTTVTGGRWLIFDDTFVEDQDPEYDPELTPPPGLRQPVRGFGKLWRENEEVRELLGYAVDTEYGFISRYEYRAGGFLNSEGQYIARPGTHILNSLGNEIFAFEEQTMTWRLVE